MTVYSFMQIVPLLSRYFAVLFCVLFSFAVAGAWRYTYAVASCVLCALVCKRVPLLLNVVLIAWTDVLWGAGMELFAGRLSPDDAEVVASSYGVNDYWPNNFDTLQSSIMVLFEQLVINNWCVGRARRTLFLAMTKPTGCPPTGRLSWRAVLPPRRCGHACTLSSSTAFPSSAC